MTKLDVADSMHAVVFQSAGHVALERVQKPELMHETDAIVRVTCASICGTDLHVLHKHVPAQKGDVIGHEAVGVVHFAGSMCAFKAGERVVISANVGCGSCEYCKRGQSSLCGVTNANEDQRKELGSNVGGVFGMTARNGGYSGTLAQFVRVPFASFNLMHAPPELADEQLIFCCDVIPTALNSVNCADLKAEQTVAVFGCGPIGLMTVQLAKQRGCKVYAIDSVTERLQVANMFGAITVNCHVEGATAALQRMEPRGVDVCIDCAGFTATKTWKTHLGIESDSPQVLTETLFAAKKGGTIVLAGYYSGVCNNVAISSIMQKSLTVRGSLSNVHQHWHEATELLRTGAIDIKPFVTHRVKLENAVDAVRVFDSRNEGVVKVIFNL